MLSLLLITADATSITDIIITARHTDGVNNDTAANNISIGIVGIHIKRFENLNILSIHVISKSKYEVCIPETAAICINPDCENLVYKSSENPSRSPTRIPFIRAFSSSAQVEEE